MNDEQHEYVSYNPETEVTGWDCEVRRELSHAFEFIWVKLCFA